MNSVILFLFRSMSPVLLSPNASARPFLSGTSLSFSMRSFVTQLSRFLNISSVLVALESKICPGANVEWCGNRRLKVKAFFMSSAVKFNALKQEMSFVAILSLMARLIRRFLFSSVFGMVPIKRTMGSLFRTLRQVFDCKVAPEPRLLRIPKLRRFTWVFRRFDTPCSTSP